jgi:hypothetical protein
MSIRIKYLVAAPIHNLFVNTVTDVFKHIYGMVMQRNKLYKPIAFR